MKMLSRVLTFLSKGTRYVKARLWTQQTYIIFEKKIDGVVRPISPRIGRIHFSRVVHVTQKHFQALSSINKYLLQANFEKDVRAGHECFIGKREDTDKIVFYVWTRQRSSRESEAGMSPAYVVTDAKEIHFFSAFTSAPYRGKGIYPAGLSYLEQYYGKLGYSRLTCSVATNNKPSLNAIQRLDYRPTRYRMIATTRFFHETRRIIETANNGDMAFTHDEQKVFEKR
jgi:RimJ/RimL family protein N-acetyltransferase